MLPLSYRTRPQERDCWARRPLSPQGHHCVSGLSVPFDPNQMPTKKLVSFCAVFFSIASWLSRSPPRAPLRVRSPLPVRPLVPRRGLLPRPVALPLQCLAASPLPAARLPPRRSRRAVRTLSLCTTSRKSRRFCRTGADVVAFDRRAVGQQHTCWDASRTVELRRVRHNAPRRAPRRVPLRSPSCLKS